VAREAIADRKAGAAAGPRAGFRVLDAILRWREASIFIVAVLLIFYFESANQAFLTPGNIRTISQITAATAIVASGLVMLLICGEIDLSVGFTAVFAPIVMYLADQTLVLPVAVVIGLVTAALVGLINGVVTVVFRVPSFIATLGMFFLLSGLNVILTDGFPKPAPEETTLTRILGAHPYAGIAWCIVIVILMHILLNHTRWGLHTFATGGNLLGASEAGVRVRFIKIGNFMLAAVLAGFAGIIEDLRIDSIIPGGPGNANTMFMAVAAAVIGGTALAGGVGTIIGAFLGTLVLSILNNGFTLQGIDASRFNVILGLAILSAMTLNVYVAGFRRMGRASTGPGTGRSPK
jgi:simple sugar transport system permease protein